MSAIRRFLTNKTAARTILSLDVVRVGAILLFRNRDITSKSSKELSTTYGISVVIRAASRIKNTIGIDNKGLNVRVTSSKNLASVDSITSNNRSVFIKASTLVAIVRRYSS